MNVISMLNRTDNTYFKMSPDKTNFLIQDAASVSWDIKKENT